MRTVMISVKLKDGFDVFSITTCGKDKDDKCNRLDNSGAEFMEIDPNNLIRDFIDWYNVQYPNQYIPNSEIGRYNLMKEDKGMRKSQKKERCDKCLHSLKKPPIFRCLLIKQYVAPESWCDKFEEDKP